MEIQEDDDLEKLAFYLDANFEIYESLLFSNLVRKPSIVDLTELRKERSDSEIEKLFNHFHMSAITLNVSRQRQYAYDIWCKWRKKLEKQLNDKNLIITICDSGFEVTLYVYRNETRVV